MSETGAILADMASRLFGAHSPREVVDEAARGKWPAGLWKALEETQLDRVGVPEEFGGAGAGLGEAMAVLKAAGRFAAPVPLAETFLAGWLLSKCGLPVPPGPLGIAPVRPGDAPGIERAGGGWRLTGAARSVPWARAVKRLAVVAGGEKVCVALVDPGDCAIVAGRNLAGEPRDDVAFEGISLSPDEVAPLGGGLETDSLWRMGALTRVVLMAGAMERLLELSVGHAAERVQFGRPIAKFQAIQHQLAVLAGEVAAAGASAEAAVAAAERGGAEFQIAAAKTRVGEAAGVAAAIAHQVHGAIGFTSEHSLHHSTKRLWSWRNEFGTEADWALRLGRLAARRGAEELWPLITSS